MRRFAPYAVAACLAVSIAALLPAQQPSAPPMRIQWEYRVLDATTLVEDISEEVMPQERFETALNKLGDDGWRLSSVSGRDRGTLFYFARPKNLGQADSPEQNP